MAALSGWPEKLKEGHSGEGHRGHSYRLTVTVGETVVGETKLAVSSEHGQGPGDLLRYSVASPGKLTNFAS